MPVDLSTQTRDLFTRIDERQEPIGLTEITALAQTAMIEVSPTPGLADVDEAATSHPVVRRSWRRSFGVAAGAAAVVLLVVGSVAWMSRSFGTEDPTDQSTTTTLATTTTIVDAAPAELTLHQHGSQLAFAASFGAVGACEGSGPWQCYGRFDVALFDGPRTVVVTVTETDDEYPDVPGNQETLLLSVATRELLEVEVGLLYEWALVNHPETTEQLCGVGFQGDDDHVAWLPGYRTSQECGSHLRALIAEYRPEETARRGLGPVLLEDAPTYQKWSLGTWGSINPAIPPEEIGRGRDIDPNRFIGDVFAVAQTGYGLIATSTDGLWISVDQGHSWEPFVRDQVVFQPESSFARVANSAAGTLVIDTNGDSPNPQNNAWFSTDGVTWTATGPPPTETESMLWLQPIDGGFLGSTLSPAEGIKPGLFHTVDGTVWEPLSQDAPDLLVGTVVETRFGYYGTARTGDSNSVWWSPDGVDWQREVLAIDGPGNVQVAGSYLDVVVLSQQGHDQGLPPPTPTLWYSSDGVEFVEDQDPGFIERLVFHVGSLTAFGDGFFVVAELDDAQSDNDPNILTGWYSRRGTNWRLARNLEEMYADDIGIRGGLGTEHGALTYGLSSKGRSNVWEFVFDG